MADDTELSTEVEQAPAPARVLADFGGRRKIFDRRMKQHPIAHNDRRSGRDRRSGFDRRSALNNEGEDVTANRTDIIQ